MLMEIDELFKQLEDFLKNEPACQKTLGCLNSQAFLGLVIGGTLHLGIRMGDQGVEIQKMSTEGADFVFQGSPAAIETMIAEKGLNPAKLGIKLVKQVLTHQLELTMPGHFLQVMRKGYIDIIKVGGTEFFAGLKEFDLSNIFKVLNFIRTLAK